MTPPGRYLVVDRSRSSRSGAARLAKATGALQAEAWATRLTVDGIEVMTPANPSLRAVQVHRRHILIGDYHGPSSMSGLCGRARSRLELGATAVNSGWGRYLLVWRDDGGDLCVLRDPSGAVDAICWERDGVAVVTDAAFDALDPLLPELSIDWTALGLIAIDVARLSDTVPLAGLRTVLPGAVTTVRTGVANAVWSPARIARSAAYDDRPQGVVRVIEDTVSTLVEPHARIIAEISGGLDSAIVASGLHRSGLAGRALFVNYHPDQPEGDERAHARSVAAWLNLPLTEIAKPRATLDFETLTALGVGFRPALHGVDFAYEADVASRLKQAGASGLLTGQGGDSLFFQNPDPSVLCDRRLRLGALAIGPRRVGAVARWTRRSSREVIRLAFRNRGAESADAAIHPWRADLADLPPAKRGQIQRFVNAQMFWTDCLRGRGADLLHPLLSQPVVEHCLAIPADHLVSPRADVARDRAFVREAYADRLPPAHLARRDKGDLSRFYGGFVRDNRATILEYLADGLWVREQGIDRENLQLALSVESLISDPRSNRFLIWCVMEAWARHWTARLERLRRPDISL